MTSRITSALLATSVHGVALLLLLAAWRAPQPGAQAPIEGQRLTTVSIAAAQDEVSKPQVPQEPAPGEASALAARVASAPSVATLPQFRPVVLELPLPRSVPVAASDGEQRAEHADTASTQAMGQGPSSAKSQASAATSDGGGPGASSAASGTPAPARSSTGSNTYAAKVFRHILSKKEFPARLAQAGIRGRVLVRFNLTVTGEITDVIIIKSSGVVVLDGLALEQIREAEPYPRPPKELTAAQLHFIVPMTYRPST